MLHLIRLQRMLLNLQKCHINLLYLSGYILADTMSKAHLQYTAEEIPEKELNAQIHVIQENAAATKQKLEEIQNEVRKDFTMIRLAEYITRGWPKKRSGLQEDLKCVCSFREELSVIDGVIYKGERIVMRENQHQCGKVFSSNYINHILEWKKQCGEPDLQYIGRK